MFCADAEKGLVRVPRWGLEILFCLAFLGAESADASLPEISSESGVLQRKLVPFIQRKMHDAQLDGLSITVVKGQQIVFSRGFGYQNREEGIPATERTIYRMGSVSKVFTALAVMQLVESGAVDLDARVTRYLPAFKMRSRGTDTSAITVRQLLTHHSGMPTDLMKGADTLEPDSLEIFIHKMKDEYLAFAPGRAFLYSNTGYAVLGRIIEVVTGEPFEAVMRESVLRPLGMVQSGFCLDDVQGGDVAMGYINGKRGAPYPMRETPAGALYASTSDMANLIKSVFNGGAPLVSAATQKEMLTRQNANSPLDLDISMGLGWQLTRQLDKDKNAGVTAWHDGWLWHFSSYMLLLPEHGLGVMVAANSDRSKKVVRSVARKAIQYLLWEQAGVARRNSASPLTIDITPGRAEAFSPPMLETFAGSYDTAAGLFTVVAREDHLEGVRNGQPVVLVPLADGRFEMRRKINAVVSWKTPELDGVYFQFIPVADQMILATMDGTVRIPFGHRVSPVHIPHAWKRRIGTWKVVAHRGDYAFIRDMQIERRHQFLVASVTIDTRDDKRMTLQLVLKPENDRQAQVMGIGRYRGDTVQVVHSDRYGTCLKFQGYMLVQTKRRAF